MSGELVNSASMGNSFFCYLSVVPVSLCDVIVGAVIDDAHLIHHTLLPFFLIIQEHCVI